MRSLEILLQSGDKAIVHVRGERLMSEGAIRSALGDPNIATKKDCVIVFAHVSLGKPLRPTAVNLDTIRKIVRRYDGWLEIETTQPSSIDPSTSIDRVFHLAVSKDVSEDALSSLLQSVMATSAPKARRFFFAQVNGVLQLVDAGTVKKRTKVPRPDSRRSQILPDTTG